MAEFVPPDFDVHDSGVRVIVSEPAAEIVERQGGRLYVWPKKSRCCGGMTTLVAATRPPADRNFRRDEASASFELYLPEHLAIRPEELHIEARGRTQRIEAYWNGCAWVV